ncbi:type II toxin-antitoxin system antitoxin DNA ADP-ribosyl glycohydrolase DarG [Palaeococcus sp. (in: euryarchaeotes)]
MIEYKKGNILEADVEALVNSVNCVGVMGRGIALQFKNAWPENFKAYAAACRRGEVKPGKMFVFETGYLTNPRYIINFPTKRHWRGKSRIQDIEAGLRALAEEIKHRGIRSIALPPLGCGLGGLNWNEVHGLIEQILGGLTDVKIIVFEPGKTPPLPKSVRREEVPEMTVGRAVLIGLTDRYIKGHLVQPKKIIELVPGAVDDAQKVLDKQPETKERFERVSRLVEGFESPHGLELLATVHWIATREAPLTTDDLTNKFYSWAERKRQFTSRQILLAARVLKEKRWIDMKF